jgi:hypothetical protein
MHEHRRLGVPVRLRPDVDPGDDDVDLVPVLGELDDPLERLRDPVHVLGAGVHRDARAGRQGEPLDGQPQLLRQIQGRDDARALGLGNGTERAQRVAAQQNPGDPVGVQRVGVVTTPQMMPAVFWPYGPLHRHEPPLSSRSYSVTVPESAGDEGTAVRRGRPSPAPPGPHDLLGVRIERASLVGRRRFDGEVDAGPGLVREAGDDRHGRPPPAAIRPSMRTSSMPAPAVIGASLVCSAVSWSRSASTGGQMCSHTWFISSRCSRVARWPGPAGSPRGSWRVPARCAAGRSRPCRHRRVTTSCRTWARATSRWSLRVVPTDAVQQQDVLGGVETGEVEVAQPPQVEPTTRPSGARRAPAGPRPGEPSGCGPEGEVADLALPARGPRRWRSGAVRDEVESAPTAVANSRRPSSVGGQVGGSGDRDRRPARGGRPGAASTWPLAAAASAGSVGELVPPCRVVVIRCEGGRRAT